MKKSVIVYLVLILAGFCLAAYPVLAQSAGKESKEGQKIIKTETMGAEWHEEDFKEGYTKGYRKGYSEGYSEGYKASEEDFVKSRSMGAQYHYRPKSEGTEYEGGPSPGEYSKGYEEGFRKGMSMGADWHRRRPR